MFDAMFTTPEASRATGPEAWLAEMLHVEAAITESGAAARLIPPDAAALIVAACTPDRFDLESLQARAVAAATPVVPLVADLRALVPEPARAYVHLGATSQDIIDTAMALLVRRATAVIRGDLARSADRLAELADTHRSTVQIGRTLLRRAVPTSFGAVCAGWLSSVDDATADLVAAADAVPLQYGGPVGIHDTLGADGLVVARLLGQRLGLPVPPIPWHTRRRPVARLAGALATVGGVLATIATAVILLCQDEIGELVEGLNGGGSSSMPHKQNPARATLTVACVQQLPGLAGTILSSQTQELQRSPGRWQAEWPTLTHMLRLTSAAARHCRHVLDNLRVDRERMRTAVATPAPLTAVDALIDATLEAHRNAGL